MHPKDQDQQHDIIDEDLYEEIDDEELYELVQQERQRAIQREKERENQKKPKRPFPKWPFWLIAIALVFNLFALIPQTFSVPAIDFLIASAKLSTQDTIQEYKKAVVVVETENSKGTGFSISANGKIITNHHVVGEEKEVTVAFQDKGLYSAEVKELYPDVDLAVLDVDEKGLPFLPLAEKGVSTSVGEEIQFIGNPLRFNGIANEGIIAGSTKLNDWEQEVTMLNAPVYRGNSGSPVINKEGKVIGVIFATMTHEEKGKVGLFIPIDYFYEKQGETISIYK
ncbi:S1C family serine protease [Virgibacillus halodenitrificans]|uniref:S1C family serine protease n=1 Tax=Virgibacillus halodenitrificans TaxID=1482 RepID=UPI0003055D88|nr:serine protease [Virgibacillus halodenitrificans]